MSKSTRINARRRDHDTSLTSDWLALLGVPHTASYSKEREKAIPFKSWFGFSRLLDDYGIDSEAYFLPDKEGLKAFTPPYMLHTTGAEGGNIIVTAVDGDRVHYLSLGESRCTTLPALLAAWDGNIFLSYPREGAAEPDVALHRRLEFFARSKKWLLGLCMAFLLVYAFIAGGLYTRVAAYFIAAIDLAGLYVTYLLVQKSLNIHNRKADRFCGVLQKGGCDDVLAMSASKFFGLFGWSEVGFAYFSVSLLAMMAFPSSLPALALCNICCLPFTFWSIWYQRFRARRWCTLCVTVQCSLWLLFLAYLAGGWVAAIQFPTWGFFVLGAAYLGCMLLINSLMPLLKRSDAYSPKADTL